MGTRDLGFSLTNNWCMIWDPLLVAHLYCLDLMSDLSTLFSDKSVDPDDRCLNTLGSLVHVLYEVLARTVGETRLRGTNITSG